MNTGTIKELRKDTIKFVFDRKFVRPKNYELKQWFVEKVGITAQDVVGVHVSLFSPTVYVKLKNSELCCSIVDKCEGALKFNHSDGNVSDVKVSHAGLGIRTVRVFELPFEVPTDEIENVLAPYGKILSNEAEVWSEPHMFPVLNAVRQLKMELQRNIPSYITVCGYRAIVMYDGQPRTCALCNSPEHIQKECSQRRRVPQLPAAEPVVPGQAVSLKLTYAAAVYPRSSAGMSTTGQEEVAASQALTGSNVALSRTDDTRTSAVGTTNEENTDTLNKTEFQSKEQEIPNMTETANVSSQSVLPPADTSSSDLLQMDIAEISNNQTGIHEDKTPDVSPSGEAPKIIEEGHSLTPKGNDKIELGLKPVTGKTSNVARSGSGKKKDQTSRNKSSIESSDHSSDLSPGGSPRRKKNKKRRLALEAAERVAPILKEKLRAIQERDKKKGDLPAGDSYERPAGNGIQTGLEGDKRVSGNGTDVHIADTGGAPQPEQGVTGATGAWSDDIEEPADEEMEEDSIPDEDGFY